MDLLATKAHVKPPRDANATANLRHRNTMKFGEKGTHIEATAMRTTDIRTAILRPNLKGEEEK